MGPKEAEKEKNTTQRTTKRFKFYLTICEYAGSFGFDVLRVELTHKKIKLAWLLSNLL